MKIIDKDKNYSIAQLAYAAGIIDGEGALTITAIENEKRKIFQSAVGVSSTDEILIDWILDVFGGWKKAYTPKQTPVNSRKKVYRWQITGKNLDIFIALIDPYIVIKKREIELLKLYRKTSQKNVGGGGLPQETIDLRKKYAAELHKIHCRGSRNL